MPRTIYLAGGLRSGWQKQVHASLKSWSILDPSTHGLDDPQDFARWDLEAIRRSDYILAYMEASNPGGYALALEIGFAKALEKKIFLVEEHPNDDRRRRFAMIRAVVDRFFPTLADALEFCRNDLEAPDVRRA